MPSGSARSLKGSRRHQATLTRYQTTSPPGRPMTVGQPPIGMPPYTPVNPAQTAVIEPTFGARITRISDKATFDALSAAGNGGTPISTIYYRHLYTAAQPWNADQSRIALQTPDDSVSKCVWILDGTTYRALSCITNCGQGSGFRWSNVDPDKAYVKKAGSPTISTIRPISNPGSTPILTDIHTFGQYTGSAFLSFAIDKGDLSLDDRYFAVVGQGPTAQPTNFPLGITVWDQQASAQVGSDYWYKQTGSGSSTNTLASVSPLGTSVIVQNSQGVNVNDVGVDSVTVVAGGSGYTTGAAVTFSGGGNLTGSAGRRQSKSGTSATANPSLGFDSAVLTNSVLAIFVAQSTNAAPTSVSLSGTAGIGQLTRSDNNASSSIGGVFYYAQISTGGTVTVTFTTTAASSFVIEEWTGIVTSTMHDVGAAAVGSTANPSIGPTATLAQSNEVAIAFCAWTTAVSPTAGAGYTADPNGTATGGPSCMAEYLTTASTAAQTATFTASAAPWVAIIGTFKISASTHATGTIAVTGGAITSITLSSPGSGYTAMPTMTIPGGTGATVCLGMQGTWWFSLQGFPGPGYQDATGTPLQTGSAAFVWSGNSHTDLGVDAAGVEFIAMLPGQSGGASTNTSGLGLPASIGICRFTAGGPGSPSMLASYDNDYNAGGHIGAHCHGRPGWLFLSDQTCSGLTGSTVPPNWLGDNGRPKWGRATAVALEVATGIFHPLCGLHTSYDTDNSATRADGSAAGTNFIHYQANISPNRDGTKALFASDWGQDGLNSLGVALVYAYVVDLPL